MTHHAEATFRIDSWEQTDDPLAVEGPKLSRATVKKTFEGDLVGTSTAELLMSGAGAASAGYVAMERFTARLHGRAGTFDLQHCAQMGGPDPQAYWLIVPGSGTGELRGISGRAGVEHDEHGAKFTLDYDFVDPT
jgi:hypothetical protein